MQDLLRSRRFALQDSSTKYGILNWMGITGSINSANNHYLPMRKVV